LPPLRLSSHHLAVVALFAATIGTPTRAHPQDLTPTVPAAEPLLALIGLPVVPWRLDRPTVTRLLAEGGIVLPVDGPAKVVRKLFSASADIVFEFNARGEDLQSIDVTWAMLDGATTQIALYNSIVTRFDRALHHPVLRDTGAFKGFARELPTGPLRQVALWSYSREAQRVLFLGADGEVELVMEPTVRALARARAADRRIFAMRFPVMDEGPPARQNYFSERTTCESASPEVSVAEVVVILGVTGAIEEVQMSRRFSMNPTPDLAERWELEKAEARTIRRFLDSCLFVPTLVDERRVRSAITIKMGQQTP